MGHRGGPAGPNALAGAVSRCLGLALHLWLRAMPTWDGSDDGREACPLITVRGYLWSSVAGVPPSPFKHREEPRYHLACLPISGSPEGARGFNGLGFLFLLLFFSFLLEYS